MADATQKLQIKLTGDSAGARAEIGATERDLKRLPDAAAAVNKESRAAAGGLRELAGSVAALVGGGLAVEQFISANREASRLRASLNVLTGDAQTTAAVWRTLQAEFGASIGVEAAASAFQKLKALGLSAGVETIRSYSNTAAAMGKSTQDFVEAVADAVTGEFERLKEFGIKAAADGDKVKLTFQGVTTEISNSAAAIEQYLVSIGSRQFGAALAEQAQTLDGAFGRVENSARQLWQALGDTGAAAALASGLNAGATALDALRQQIGDGSLFAGLAESAEQSGAVAAQSIESLGVSLAGVQYAATETGRVIAEAIPEGVRFAAEALAELPLNLRTATGIMLGELDKFGADANAVWENVKLNASIAWSATTNVVIESTDRMRRALSGVAESAARALASALGVEGASFGFEGGIPDRTTDRTQEVAARRAQIAAERQARQDAADAAVAGFLRERDAARTTAAERAALAEGDRRRSRALRDASDRERFRAAAVAATGAAAASAGSQAAAGAKKAASEQKRFADELARTVAAVDPVAGAVARYSEQVGTLDAALSKGLITQQRHDALVRDAALDYRDKVDVVGAYIRKIEQENQLLGLNGTEREQARAVLEAETAARRAGLEVTDAQREAIRGLVAEQEQLRAQVEPMAKLYERAAEEIYSGWSKMWEDLFSGGIKSFKDFGRQALDYLRRLLGQLAAQALARPVLVPVITALGGTLGMSQGAIGGTLQQLGLGGGATTTSATGGGLGVGNLSSFSNLFSGSGISGAFVGAGNWLANTTGIGAASSAGVSPASLGVMGVPGGVGTATANGGIFAGAAGLPNWAFGAAGLGGGLLGSLIAPASPYGSLAGGLGGVAGMVGASGLASGTALGAALGSAVPVLGTLIGGALGGVIARAFGDSQPDSSWFRVTSGSRSGRDARYSPLAEAQTAFGSVAVSGWEDLPGDMQKEFSAGIVQAFSQTDAALAAQLGAQYVAIARQAIDGQALASARQLASKDPSAQVLAIFRARYGAIFGAIDSDLAAAFGRQSVTADSIGQVVAELGELFSATHPAAVESLGQYASAAKALDAQWSRLTDNARKYGYQLDAVTTAWAKATSDLKQTAVDALHGDFTAAREQALLGGLDAQGRYDYFKSQADGLAAQLERAAGADNINAIAERILSLQSQAYGLLGDQAGDYSAQYVDYLDRIEQLAAARIRATDVQTTDMGKQIQAGVEAVLQRALDALAAAADAQTRAAERITRALPGYG